MNLFSLPAPETYTPKTKTLDQMISGLFSNWLLTIAFETFATCDLDFHPKISFDNHLHNLCSCTKSYPRHLLSETITIFYDSSDIHISAHMFSSTTSSRYTFAVSFLKISVE